MNIWARVDQLLSQPRDVDALRAHGVQLLAARRWRDLGIPIPPALRSDERDAALTALAAPALIERVLRLLDRPVTVIKGPEVAARYPDPALRPFGDLDLIVADAADAQSRLLRSGFQPIGQASFYQRHHHRQPLHLPGSPLFLELHDTPGWPAWMTPPESEALAGMRVPSALRIDGLVTLQPAQHALLICAHAWQDNPLGRLLPLIDIAALLEEAGREETGGLAREWGMGRVWAATLRAIDIVLGETTAQPWPRDRWASNLLALRQRSGPTLHLAQWLAPLWASHPRYAARALLLRAQRTARPFPDEPLLARLRRARRLTTRR